MKYMYFVSFSHRSRWGNLEIISKKLLDNMKDLNETQRVIKELSDCIDPVMISFQLLRAESEGGV